MVKAIFPAHGEMDAHIEGRILMLIGDGIWNPEQYIESLSLREPLMRELNDAGPWGQLAVICGDVYVHAGTLDVLKQRVAADPLRTRLVAYAFVASPDRAGYAVMLPILVKALQASRPCEVFHSEEDAASWLNQQITAVAG